MDDEGTTASDYSGMEWPRTYISLENGTLAQDNTNTEIIQLATGNTPTSPNLHSADLLWCGLADTKESLNLREDAERIRAGLPPFQRARLHFEDDSYFVGVIDRDQFIAHDSVHNGRSYFDLVDERLQYDPIPLSEIMEMKLRLEYL